METPQPENTEKKKAGTNQPGAQRDRYRHCDSRPACGLNKQQATRQNATTSELAPSRRCKSAGKSKSELEGVIKQQADQLNEAKHQQETLAKQLDELQQKVAVISGSDAKTGCWPVPTSSSSWRDVSCGAIRMSPPPRC